MKIAYDYQIFNLQKYGGISRYIYELATQIAKIPGYKVKVLAGLYFNEYLKNCSSDLVVGWSRTNIPKSIKITSQLNNQLSKIWLRRDCPDIVHETYYSPSYLPRSPVPKSCRTVITVHDMIHEKFSSLMPTERNLISSKAKAIRRADHIICVSNNTKKDLIEILDIESQRISVIYPGYSLQINNNHFHSKNLDKIVNHPYILYVGQRKYYYKNFERLLQAYANRNSLNQHFNLVCFGAEKLSQSELNKIRDLGIREDQVVYVTGCDRTLAKLYSQASAFVYPSLYEGFGIPPLEAMSFDCPVVCSNISSIPEVVGNAAEFFNPCEIDSIADSLERVLFSSEKTKNLIELGRKRVKHFSWEACAEQTSLVYLSLL